MRRAIGIAVLVGLVASPALAQEWSAAQQEVWENVKTYSELAAQGDVEGFVQYFHEDFSGWVVDNPLPDSREQRVSAVRHLFPLSKTLWSQIKPIAIKIHGNIAIVHYYGFASQVQQGDDKPQPIQARWTDILMKQGSRWVMIADHGGSPPDDD